MPLAEICGYRLDHAYRLRGEKLQQFPVQSRIIQGVFFSQEDGQLRIWFKNGEIHDFTGVSKSEVAAMCDAKSPGHRYIDRIRKQCQRIAA